MAQGAMVSNRVSFYVGWRLRDVTFSCVIDYATILEECMANTAN